MGCPRRPVRVRPPPAPGRPPSLDGQGRAAIVPARHAARRFVEVGPARGRPPADRRAGVLPATLTPVPGLTAR